MTIFNGKVEFGYSSLVDGNLDFRFGKQDIVKKRREEFFARNHLIPQKSVVFIAEHANKIAEVGPEDAGKGVFSSNDQFVLDGLITRSKGLNLCLLVADCVALVLYDKTNGILALVHVGSKNLALGTVGKAVEKMREAADGQEAEIGAATSPFIKKCCYDFYKIPEHLIGLKEYFIERDKLFYLDTEKVLHEQLLAAGLKEENIEISKLCSYHDKFPSHRRSDEAGESESRMLVYAKMI